MERGIFFGCLLVGISLFNPSLVPAITWEFDEEGNAQGWTSFEGASSGNLISALPPLQSQIADGVWRIELASFKAGLVPAVELVSPRIGHDSALFDRVVIRFRVVHTRPLVGSIQLRWTNILNRNAPGGSPAEATAGRDVDLVDVLRFQYSVPGETFTTDWQEFTIANLGSGPVTQADGLAFDILWEQELIDFRLQMAFRSEEDSEPDEWPQAIEIDRIVLSGVEEQLQGELPPPSVEETPEGGGLFASPAFFFLDQPGLGGDIFPFSPAGSGALGDLDADGDLDLVLPSGGGWLAALNDGEGQFAKSYVEKVGFTWTPYLNGADIDGDGHMDLLLMSWGDAHQYLARFRLNDPLEGWIDGPAFPDVRGLGLADADGDGYADVWLVSGYSTRDLASSDQESRRPHLVLYRNDQSGHFQTPLIFSIDTDETKYFPWRWVHHLRGGKRGILWLGREGKGYAITSLNEMAEMELEPLITDIDYKFVLYAGDVDQDGDVDLLASERAIRLAGSPYERGLDLWRNQGDNSLVQEEWLPEVILNKDLQPEPVLFFDLNQDGILDPVMVDHDERQPALVVGLGRPDGPPEVERCYFEGRGGTLLGGDLDGDGDTDLVMVRRDSGSEGVYVLKNRWAEQRTAVTAEAGATPSRFHLAQNYPNPFNPQTWIPFEIPGEGGFVDLRIYNVLGQPIRTLVAGRLGAGRHLVPWDGRDSQGQAVSAGMYLYRLQTGDRPITRKMLKVE